MSQPPTFSPHGWPRMRDVAAMAFTLVLLLAWLLALALAWRHWTTRSDLESIVLLVLAAGVVGMGIGFVRAVHRHRRRWVALAQRGEWRQATVVEIARGFDPRGIEIGVPYRWIVTAAAQGADGSEVLFRSAPVRRLRDVRALMGQRVWVRADPADPSCHVLLPVAAA
jgi:hypothetical protein